MVDQMSSNAMRGTVETESTEIPYVDLRCEPAAGALEKLNQFIEEIAAMPAPGATRLRGLALMAPQPSGNLALSLAARGVMLIIGDGTDSLPTLIDRFRNQLCMFQSLSSPTNGLQTAAGGTAPPNTADRTKSPYAQRPAWFDQAAFDERMQLLQQPWREEDAWKTET
jgi:hypothetical protein